MSAEEYAIPMIERELARIRREAPDAATVRRKYNEAQAHYIEHVCDGRGDVSNGGAIMAYYVTRQAYFLYAMEKEISLEVM